MLSSGQQKYNLHIWHKLCANVTLFDPEAVCNLLLVDVLLSY